MPRRHPQAPRPRTRHLEDRWLMRTLPPIGEQKVPLIAATWRPNA
jgi:hypothetical protein